jgi:hypothetical protein
LFILFPVGCDELLPRPRTRFHHGFDFNHDAFAASRRLPSKLD